MSELGTGKCGGCSYHPRLPCSGCAEHGCLLSGDFSFDPNDYDIDYDEDDEDVDEDVDPEVDPDPEVESESGGV